MVTKAYAPQSGELAAHGTTSRYRQGCRCVPCAQAKKVWRKSHTPTPEAMERLLRRKKIDSRQRKYNISEKEYNAMVYEHRNLCGICHQPEIKLTRSGEIQSLSVDHNHTTGAVRGLLCNNCNAALGLLRENKLIISQMMTYITKYEEVQHA